MTSFDIPRFTTTANFGDDFRTSVFIAPKDVYVYFTIAGSISMNVVSSAQ